MGSLTCVILIAATIQQTKPQRGLFDSKHCSKCLACVRGLLTKLGGYNENYYSCFTERSNNLPGFTLGSGTGTGTQGGWLQTWHICLLCSTLTQWKTEKTLHVTEKGPGNGVQCSHWKEGTALYMLRKKNRCLRYNIKWKVQATEQTCDDALLVYSRMWVCSHTGARVHLHMSLEENLMNLS